ncbi:MAG TPA: hypothetical protein VF434_13475 [Promineifilum sp.]
MPAVPGSASGVVLGFLLASLYGAAFHMLFGGSIRRIALFMGAAWLGFFIGQFVGDFLNLEILKLGKIHLVPASVGAWLMLLAARWLAGQEP